MRVKIAHSIDSDEVLTFIANLLTKQSNILDALNAELEESVKDMQDKNSCMDMISFIDNLRQELYDVDVALDESKQILVGYTQNVLIRSEPKLFSDGDS